MVHRNLKWILACLAVAAFGAVAFLRWNRFFNPAEFDHRARAHAGLPPPDAEMLLSKIFSGTLSFK